MEKMTNNWKDAQRLIEAIEKVESFITKDEAESMLKIDTEDDKNEAGSGFGFDKEAALSSLNGENHEQKELFEDSIKVEDSVKDDVKIFKKQVKEINEALKEDDTWVK